MKHTAYVIFFFLFRYSASGNKLNKIITVSDIAKIQLREQYIRNMIINKLIIVCSVKLIFTAWGKLNLINCNKRS